MTPPLQMWTNWRGATTGVHFMLHLPHFTVNVLHYYQRAYIMPNQFIFRFCFCWNANSSQKKTIVCLPLHSSISKHYCSFLLSRTSSAKSTMRDRIKNKIPENHSWWFWNYSFAFYCITQVFDRLSTAKNLGSHRPLCSLRSPPGASSGMTARG